jgi:hypothetical protein
MDAARIWSAAECGMGWVGQYTAAVYRVEVEQVDKLHTPLPSVRAHCPAYCEVSENR